MFFSNLTDVRQFIEVPIRASSKFNEVFALMPRLPKSIIGVDGVNQILPAQETIFRSSSAQSSFPWTPWKGHTAEPINNRALAMAELRQSIFQTVAQLSHSNETILHSLGGLDSAIVLGALANSRQSTKVIAYNGFTGAPAGDERVFARAAAQFTSTSLHEIFLDPRRVNLRSVLEWPHQPNPVAYFDCTGPAGNVYELAKQVGANSLWNGVGGDNVFFQLPDIIAALEIVGTGASMSQIFRVALDGARYGRQSFWHVISNMVKERVKPPNRNAVLQFFTPRFRLPFLNDDIVQAGMQTKFLHPLLQAPDGTRNAKYYHVLTTCCFAIDLYDPWQFISGGPKPLERISPLLAQPVVETCLRIAPWLFIDGGMDRGLARKALASVLSQTTAGRTSKSNPDALYDEVTRANSLFIRETLLDGLLVRDGILKRRTLECNFNSDGSLSIDALRVALDLFNWEAWTRSVQNQN
jgi:asparagine synthase (glutamine-hydrolysing)